MKICLPLSLSLARALPSMHGGNTNRHFTRSVFLFRVPFGNMTNMNFSHSHITAHNENGRNVKSDILLVLLRRRLRPQLGSFSYPFRSTIASHVKWGSLQFPFNSSSALNCFSAQRREGDGEGAVSPWGKQETDGIALKVAYITRISFTNLWCYIVECRLLLWRMIRSFE